MLFDLISFDSLDLELIITAIVYGLTFLVGMIGNSLIVYSVVQFRQMKSLSNVFLASLATADLILIIVCVPVKFIQLFSYTWTFGGFLCKFVHYIQNLSAICSVYTLTAMSIERYYAIMYPVECRYICTMSQTKRIITLTWIGSIILAMPVWWIMILLKVGGDETGATTTQPTTNSTDGVTDQSLLLLTTSEYTNNITASSLRASSNIIANMGSSMMLSESSLSSPALSSLPTTDETTTTTIIASGSDAKNASDIGYWCVPDWKNKIGWQLHECYMLLVILIIPLTIMTYSYAHICNKLWSVMHNRTSAFPLSQQAVYIDSSANKMSQVIKMLIVVVVIFVLCWSPILILNVLKAFDLIPHLNYGYWKEIKKAFHLFSYANSCVNPIIYGFMSRNFRASFKGALVKCLGCKRNFNEFSQII